MTGRVRLRRMRWWDVEPALALERQLFPGDPWSAELFWSELAGWPATRHYLVAVRGDELVGYAGLSAPAGDADVQTLAVAPAAQGTGIGRALLTALLDEAARRRAPAVLLEARVDNERAIGLYESVGFERIAVRRGYYDAGRVDAAVLRRLTPDS
ncbi:ribosomal protein S18-alanine N-acetyltransferase [Motilibacter aurantiacus]|uniref:ribosomal protein S18-alanine N-acetyltransferase n=1 Tax=Motilibacter aurantiacus TaxID=2714955 RepID=UPI001408B881|nr:ribosomal protein S18-alanine N-acetyltransferase [Motilibacter aurantiacus]NHC44007.1 ribosomal protein S18-alanine N-acetyltransferase [Motilibacter aurantiacus]